RLSWFNGNGASEAWDIQPGDRWQFTVRLRRPHGFASPGAFDYEGFLARQGIQATGYIKSGVCLSEASLLDRPFDQLRMKLRNWLEKAASPENRGMLVALTTGDKSGISQQQWQRLNISGTTHLMVISGLHIGLMATVGMAMAVLLARLGVLPISVFPLPLLGGALALSLAMLYALLAGFSIPVQRALVMLVVALSGPLVGIKSSSFTLWAAALATVLAIEPLAVTSQGFWYSFMAVAALLFGLSGRSHRSFWLAKLGKPQWVVFCVLAPLLLVNGQAVSPLSPLINLVAIPLIGLLVVPLLLLASCLYPGIPWLAHPVLFLADGLISAFNGLLSLCEPWLLAIPSQLATGPLSMVLAVLGMFLLIAPSALGLRWLSPFLLFPFVLPVENLPVYGQAEINVLDVGQGLSVLIRTRNHVLLYDTGDRFSDQVTAADRVIFPALASVRVRHIDRVIISHGDRDHAGGLATLSDRLGPLDVWSGSPIPDFTGTVRACIAGAHWDWDGVQFQVLAGGGYAKSNESSCVVKVLAGNDSVLLPGDISARVERRLIAMGIDLSARTLLAAHHGSRHS
ncbi:MAG: DNA internalization-related competence protein ComEC/Rec2, partial [Endozoicomonas sp.]